jgi:hypothetical protein
MTCLPSPFDFCDIFFVWRLFLTIPEHQLPAVGACAPPAEQQAGHLSQQGRALAPESTIHSCISLATFPSLKKVFRKPKPVEFSKSKLLKILTLIWHLNN